MIRSTLLLPHKIYHGDTEITEKCYREGAKSAKDFAFFASLR